MPSLQHLCGSKPSKHLMVPISTRNITQDFSAHTGNTSSSTPVQPKAPTQMEEEAEDEAQQELMHQWSPLESLMIQKMDAMLHLHQEHSVDVHNTLENITTRLENIETRLTLSNLNWMRMKRSYVLVLGFAVC